MSRLMNELLAYGGEPSLRFEGGVIVAEYQGNKATVSVRNKTVSAFKKTYAFTRAEECITLLRWLFGVDAPLLWRVHQHLAKLRIETLVVNDDKSSLPIRVEGTEWGADWWLTYRAEDGSILFASDMFDNAHEVNSLEDVIRSIYDVRAEVVAKTPAELSVTPSGNMLLYYPSLKISHTVDRSNENLNRVLITKVIYIAEI